MTCVMCGDENGDYRNISDERSEEVVLESSPALGTMKKLKKMSLVLNLMYW